MTSLTSNDSGDDAEPVISVEKHPQSNDTSRTKLIVKIKINKKRSPLTINAADLV